jgi:hypothetical protein
MTERPEVAGDDRDPEALRALLKRSLSKNSTATPSLLAGVQRRIRQRSRGKFFADGWSTAHTRVSHVLSSPRPTSRWA